MASVGYMRAWRRKHPNYNRDKQRQYRGDPIPRALPRIVQILNVQVVVPNVEEMRKRIAATDLTRNMGRGN